MWWRGLVVTIESIYALLVASLILILSTSPYEGMIGEVVNNERLTICSIPPPIDDASRIYIVLTIPLILLPLVGGIVSYIQTRRLKPIQVIGVVLLSIWIYRFFLRKLGC